jgi:hypothetical protein
MKRMRDFKKWLRKCFQGPGALYVYIVVGSIVFLFLFISFCRVSKEPDRVWDLRGKIVVLARSLTGLPYRYGGEEINGFDCSGFVYYVYDSYGIKLPRTAEKQAKMKEKIKLRQAKPADILAFRFKRRWHTAIYIGNNSFIHAPNRRTRVRVESLNKSWKRHLKYVIRLIDE